MAINIDGTDEAKVGWVWNIGNRGTFDVLWSCLSVVLVCTYKVIHLNLPARGEAQASWNQLLFWKKWLRKLKWMGFMALSPELLLAMALQDFLWSRQSEQKFERTGANHVSSLCSSKLEAGAIDSVEDRKPASTDRPKLTTLRFRDWTKVHAHFANMGGFNIRYPRIIPTEPQPQPESGKQTAPKSNANRDASENQYQSFPLSAQQILVLVEEFSIEIPFVTREDIKDRSKSDAFTKIFAIGQSSWLIVQCIARAAQGLPISQLELATMGFVGCALVMYILWWHKPFDVEYSVAIDCPAKNQDRILQRLRQVFEARYDSQFLSPSWNDFLREQRIPNWAYMDEGSLGIGHRAWLASMLSIMGMGMAFSALHLSAWNWTFPSIVEKYLWRSAALVATAVVIPTATLLPLLGTGRNTWQRYVVLGFNYPLVGLYLLCRTILLVQVFLCFRAMPEGVYETVNWVSFLPHFS